jgi:hypothetical protein
MTVRRMLALLAAWLLFGALVATLDGDDPLLVNGVLVGVFLWIVAVLIAGALLAPVALFGRGRPSRAAIAVALAFAGALVYPMYGSFYDTAYWASKGSQVGLCGGYIPLGQAVQNAVTNSQYAPFAFATGCDD